MSELVLTKDNFDKEVLQADKPVVVDFWAPWCGPCKMMGPVIEKLSNKADGRFIVGKVNVDDEDELSEKYGIMSIPAIMVFKNGKVTSSRIGYSSEDSIIEMIEKE